MRSIKGVYSHNNYVMYNEVISNVLCICNQCIMAGLNLSQWGYFELEIMKMCLCIQRFPLNHMNHIDCHLLIYPGHIACVQGHRQKIHAIYLSNNYC